MNERYEHKLNNPFVEFSPEEMERIQEEAERQGFRNVSDYLLNLHHSWLSERSPTTCDHDVSSDLPESLQPVISTDLGQAYCGDAGALMPRLLDDVSVDLIVTSPPYGLVRKKEYGNVDADLYVAWFERFAHEFARILKPKGSLVIDIGGVWNKGEPTRSLYQYELLIMLCRKFGFNLAQEFFWWNPSKLPTPAEWVTVRRIRVKDAVNCIWWLSKTPFPKVTNRRVLQPYSQSMRQLLKKGYRPKLRPSGHDISEKFGRDNKGSIPPNLLALANTESNGAYQRYCQENDLPRHPARFPEGIPAFFIRMLTDRGDLVLDPFAGSCVSGSVAEKMRRRWLCLELESIYLEGAKGRFFAIERHLPLLDYEGRGIIKRTDPYEIHPPSLSILDEESSPLAEDGGEKRSDL